MSARPDPIPAADALPPVATPGLRKFCLLALCAIAVQMAWFGASSIGNQAADFEYFYKGSHWLLEHGTRDPRYDILPNGQREARGGIEWYLPFVPRLYTVISWMPLRVAGTLWLAANLTVFFCLVRLIGRKLTGLPPQDWPVTQLVPVLVLALFWHWEFRLNQINNLTLLLLVGGFVQWQAGRKVLPGLWLGLAVLLKLTPMLLMVWYALKREFRVVAVALLTVVLAGPVSDVIAFGPGYAGQWYRGWFQTAVEKGSHRELILNQREMDWRNQGLGAVACHWLHSTNYATHFDNDPRIRYPDNPKTMNIVDLPLPVVAAIVMAIVAASGLGLLWLARRPAGRCSPWQLRLEFALFVMAMLWFMPVMRRYHLIWMLPSVSVLGACIHHMTLNRRWSRWALAAVGFVFAAEVAIISRTMFNTHIVEASGAFLLGLPVIALPMIVLIIRLARDPMLMPEDVYVTSAPARRAHRPVRRPPADVPLPATAAHA